MPTAYSIVHSGRRGAFASRVLISWRKEFSCSIIAYLRPGESPQGKRSRNWPGARAGLVYWTCPSSRTKRKRAAPELGSSLHPSGSDHQPSVSAAPPRSRSCRGRARSPARPSSSSLPAWSCIATSAWSLVSPVPPPLRCLEPSCRRLLLLPGRSAVSSPPTEIVVATFVWLQRSTVLGCINVVVGDAGPCGRRWRSGRSVPGATLRDWPALRPDAPSARRPLTVSRPAGCCAGLSGDEVGGLGEQLASTKSSERAVWSTADVGIGIEVRRDAPAWGRSRGLLPGAWTRDRFPTRPMCPR